MGRLFESHWTNDSKPFSPPKACAVSVIGALWVSKIALLATALAHVGILLNGGFFYIDTSNRVNFGGCFTNGDLFSLCINGMAISVVSVTLAWVFILKDFIMAAVNSYSWTRWMQVVDATSFLLLSIWWAVSAALFYITRENNASGDGMLAASGNSTVPAPNLAEDATAAYGMSVSTGLQFALLGSSVGCFLTSGLWLFFSVLFCHLGKKGKRENAELMTITVVTVVLTSTFILKDFIVVAWTRWMQVVEATSFLLLSIWWAMSATLFHITRRNIAAGDGMLAASGNSTVPAPNLAQDATAANGMSVSTGLQFALLGSSASCLISSSAWLFFNVLCAHLGKGEQQKNEVV